MFEACRWRQYALQEIAREVAEKLEWSRSVLDDKTRAEFTYQLLAPLKSIKHLFSFNHNNFTL